MYEKHNNDKADKTSIPTSLTDLTYARISDKFGSNDEYTIDIGEEPGLQIYQKYDDSSGIGFTGNGIYMWSANDDTCLSFYNEYNGALIWEIDADGWFTGCIKFNNIIDKNGNKFFNKKVISSSYNFLFSANSKRSNEYVPVSKKMKTGEIYLISINHDGYIDYFDVGNTGDTNSLKVYGSGIFVVPPSANNNSLAITAYLVEKSTSASSHTVVISVILLNTFI